MKKSQLAPSCHQQQHPEPEHRIERVCNYFSNGPLLPEPRSWLYLWFRQCDRQFKNAAAAEMSSQERDRIFSKTKIQFKRDAKKCIRQRNLIFLTTRSPERLGRGNWSLGSSGLSYKGTKIEFLSIVHGDRSIHTERACMHSPHNACTRKPD